MMYLVNFEPVRGLFETKADAFYAEIQAAPTRSWWHYLRDSWIVITSEELEQLDLRLRRLIAENDHLLIVKMDHDTKYAGWLPKDAWEWIVAQASAGAYWR